MRKILAVLLMAVLFSSGISMLAPAKIEAASVSSTFTATGNSSALFVPAGQKFRIVISNTWVGTITVTETNNGGASYSILDSYTANVNADYDARTYDRLIRLTCNSYTSGTVTYVVSNAVTVLGRFTFPVIPVGGAAYGSTGTSTTPVSGTEYNGDIFVPVKFQPTGVACLNGATVGTNLWIYTLRDSTGRLMANTAVAGTTSAGADAFQAIAFTSTPQPVAPGEYFLGFQTNGTTDRFRTVATLTFVDVLSTSTTGTFGTIPATMTVPTTFTADKAPICYLY